jgi:hypothetical protein
VQRREAPAEALPWAFPRCGDLRGDLGHFSRPFGAVLIRSSGVARQRGSAEKFMWNVYADHPIDLAGASLMVAAETLTTRKVFTIDRKDFAAYRVRRGHRRYASKSSPEFVWHDRPQRGREILTDPHEPNPISLR